MSGRSQRNAIHTSAFFDAAWYLQTYPDVRLGGMDPAEHFLAIGADLDRNPGPDFDTAFYLKQLPQGQRPRLNPLLHYFRYGRAAGREPAPRGVHAVSLHEAADWLSYCLFGIGVDPCETSQLLRADAWRHRDGPAEAALRLAINRLARGGRGDDAAAVAMLEAARPLTRDLRARIAAATVFAASDSQPEIGERAFARAAAAGLLTPDLLLARAALVPPAALRRLHLHKALELAGLSPVLPSDRTTQPVQIVIPSAPEAQAASNPLLTVVLPVMAHEPLPLGALQALRGQGAWGVQIVLVDAGLRHARQSGEASALLANDGDRIVDAPEAASRGAALTAGLAAATGRYVLAWPEAGWVHPQALARCLSQLLADGGAAMALGRSAVVDEALRPVQIAPDGAIAAPDPRLALIETVVLRERLGGWDPAAPEPQTDLWHRARLNLGESAVATVAAGPLLLRPAEAQAGPVRHAEAYPSGAARLALAIEGARLRSGRVADSGTATPRSALDAMQPALGLRDIVYGVDLCSGGEAMIRTVREARAMKRAGLTVALFDLSTADPARPGPRHLAEEAFEHIEVGKLRVLSGEVAVSCRLLLVASPAGLAQNPRHLPPITASEAVIVADATALAEAGNGAAVVEHWRKGLQRFAGLRGAVYAADAVSARALAGAGVPCDGDGRCWHPVVEPRVWQAGRRRGGGGALRIGHHDCTGPDGWPATAALIRAAFRPVDDLEIRVFGEPDLGARQGSRPAGWHIVDGAAGAEPEFLRSLDVFVYFPQASAHGRAARLVAEAMAAGLPVVTDPELAEVFGEAAAYAAPEDAVAMARKLARNRAARAALRERADAYLAATSSPEAHFARLAAVGLRPPQTVAA